MHTSNRQRHRFCTTALAAILLGVVTASFGAGPSVLSPQASKENLLLLIELDSGSLDQNHLTLSYLQFYTKKGILWPSSEKIFYANDIAKDLKMVAEPKASFFVIIPKYRALQESKFYEDCVILMRGSSSVKAVTLRSATDRKEGDRHGVTPKSRCEVADEMTSVDVKIMKWWSLGDEFLPEPTLDNLYYDFLIIDSKNIEKSSQGIKLLDDLIESKECVSAIEWGQREDSPRYHVCRRDRFDTDDGTILSHADQRLVADLPTGQTLEDFRHRSIQLSGNAGWRKWTLESSSKCKVPASGITIIDKDDQLIEVPLRPGKSKGQFTLYLPDVPEFFQEDKWTPFELQMEKWRNHTACLALKKRNPRIQLLSDGDHMDVNHVMSENEIQELTNLLQKWALGHTASVQFKSAFSVPTDVVPRLDDRDETIIVLSGIDWHQFKLNGKNGRGESVNLAGWRLVRESGDPVIVLDEEGSVASYRLITRMKDQMRFTIEPPSNGSLSVDFDIVTPASITIQEDDLGRNPIEVDIDFMPRQIMLKPARIYGIAPIFEIELHDGTVINVAGETGRRGIRQNQITIYQPEGKPCPKNSSEVEKSPSRDISDRRMCRIVQGDVEGYKIEVRDLKAATPVGLSSVNRSDLRDWQKRENFANMFSIITDRSLKDRRDLFRRAFASEKYGIDLYADRDAVVVVRHHNRTENECRITELQNSPVSDFFRIANGYERDRWKVWSESGWKPIDDVQNKISPVANQTHAYILVTADDFRFNEAVSSDQRWSAAGGERRQSFLHKILAGEEDSPSQSPLKTASGRLEIFRALWSKEADKIFKSLREKGVGEVTFYVAYTSDGKLAFKSLGTPVEIDPDNRQRLEFRKLHEHVYNERYNFIHSRSFCKDPYCFSREFQRYLESDCDFRPLSHLFILTERRLENSSRYEASPLLKACVVEGLLSRGEDMVNQFKYCNPLE